MMAQKTDWQAAPVINRYNLAFMNINKRGLRTAFTEKLSRGALFTLSGSLIYH